MRLYSNFYCSFAMTERVDEIVNDLYEISKHFATVRPRIPLESIRLNGGKISDEIVLKRLCKLNELKNLRCCLHSMTQDEFDSAIVHFRCSQLQELTVKIQK